MPDTVRQHLAANARHELDALRAELDVRLIALETALAQPDSGASLESLVLDLARVVAAEAESAAARASLEAQLHAQDDSAAATTQLQRQLDAERANASAIQLELEQVHAALDAERGAAQTLRLELAQTKTALDSEHGAATRLREEFDELRESLKGERVAGDAPRRHVDELEQTLKTERARGAEIEAELELQRDSAAHMSEALAAVQRQLAASQQRAADARASEAEAHRSAVEALDRRHADLERQHHAATAQVSKLSSERDGLATTLEAERSQAAASQAAAADAHRAAIEALERRYTELEGEFGAANDLASEAANERDALAATLETERRQSAATLAAERQQASAALETEKQHASAALETERQQSAAVRDAAAAARDESAAARDAAADAHRKAIEVLEGRCATLEGQSRAADARAAEAIDARNALAVAAEAEREQAVLVQESADDAHRATVETLERRITELEGEYAASTALSSEVAGERDALAATLEEERQEAAAEREAAHDAHRAAINTLERRVATLEGDYHAANALVSEVSSERDALTAALEDERRKAVAAHTADDETRRAAVDALERRCTELDRRHTEATERASKVEAERAALEAALETERQQAAAARTSAETRVASIDAERLNAERSRLEAEARVEEAASERDELISERDDLMARLEAAGRMTQDMRTAVEGRLTTIDDVHKRAVKAKEQAEARADAAVRERDALASELAAVRQSASPDPESGARLEAATERIRVLELELFQRDRGPRERDVDLVPLLDTTASPPSAQAGKSAKRYAFPAATNIRIDREGGLLADLSVTGAQVIVKTSPEVGREVTLALLSDEAPCFCQGRLLWARREQTAKGRPYRYRVGLMFTSADEAAIEAFIKVHAIG